MHRTVLAFVVAAGLCVTGYLWAGEGGEKKKGGALKAAAAGKEGGCSKSCADKIAGGGCGKGVAEMASYQRAEEVLKSWQEAPARLAALSESDKGELQAVFAKLEETHPAGPVIKPTMAFLHKGLGTLARMDAAAGKMCSQAAKPTSCAGGESAVAVTPVAEAEPKGCPKAAAAMASARKKLQRSVALTAKANELMLVVHKAGGHEGCSAKAEGKSGGCGAKIEATLTSAADGKQCTKSDKAGGCGAKTEATLTAAAGEKEKQCAKTASASGCGAKTEATLTAAADGKQCTKSDKAGGCGAKTEATLTAAAGEKEKQCAKAASAGGCGAKTEATLTAAADGKQCTKSDKAGGCGAKTEATLTAAAGEKQCEKSCADKAECAKKLTVQAREVIAESGELLARWRGAGIRLTSMDSAEREAAEKVAAAATSQCPLGSRMPATLDAIAALLNDAAALNAQAMAVFAKNADACKAIPAEVRQLTQARGEVIAALINVLEQSNGTMRPARQVVSAQ